MSDPSSIPPAARALDSIERDGLLDDMADIVTSSHLFGSLDDTGRARVLRSGYVCSFAPGEVIVREGEPGDTMYIVMRGTVRIETANPTGLESGSALHLAELGRGACFGEVSLLSGAPRTATVTAVADVDCVAFAKHRIERVLDDYPTVREQLEALVEGRARDTIDKLIGS